MKIVKLPGVSGEKSRDVTVGFLWDHHSSVWIAVVSDIQWRYEVGRAAEQQVALVKAVDRFFKGLRGYVTEQYPHEEVWKAFCAAREMPASPIVSIPV